MLNLRTIRFILWALVGLTVSSAAILAWRVAGNQTQPQDMLKPGRPMAEGADWRLLDETGRPFTPSNLRGRLTLVVFGFTHCPDVCPTSLSYVANALQALGPQAESVTPLFLTVDPERDTVEIMAEYTALFDERILGVTGESDEVAAALRSLGAFARKAPLDGGGYNVDHSSSMLLLDAQGRLRSTLDVHEPAEVAAEKVRRLLATT